MIYFVGTDEAGYGPNLGPLVVATTVWRYGPGGMLPEDFYPRLVGYLETSPQRASSRWQDREGLPEGAARGCSTKATRGAGAAAGRPSGCVAPVLVADSKSLYHSGQGLQQLERGIFSLLGQLGPLPTTWSQLWERLAPGSEPPAVAGPEYRDFEAPAITTTTATELVPSIDWVRQGLAAANLELIHLEAEVLFPRRFNKRVTERGSKGTVLTETTLELVERVTCGLKDGEIWIRCDKHGGRANYAPALQMFFPDQLVRVCEEGRAASRYEWGTGEGRRRIEFVAKGEGFLPAALASMIAKYLRERAMEAFNSFWLRQVPGLEPTAGYPVDAQRFWEDTAAARRRLAIPDSQLWRQR